MGKISLGDNKIRRIYFGNQTIKSVYLGDKLIWTNGYTINFHTVYGTFGEYEVGTIELSNNGSIVYTDNFVVKDNIPYDDWTINFYSDEVFNELSYKIKDSNDYQVDSGKIEFDNQNVAYCTVSL